MGLISNGTTIFDAGVLNAGGSMSFIKKLTASSSSTLSFVDGSSSVVLDSTYKEYMFIFNNIHPQTNAASLTFQGNAAGGSGFDETITSTYFRSRHNEDDSDGAVNYDESYDLNQSTNFQTISYATGNENDECASGTLRIFNPSSTTFVKHFMSTLNMTLHWNVQMVMYGAGYGNTTSAVDAIQFKMNTGNIDAGDICLYGIA